MKWSEVKTPNDDNFYFSSSSDDNINETVSLVCSPIGLPEINLRSGASQKPTAIAHFIRPSSSRLALLQQIGEQVLSGKR